MVRQVTLAPGGVQVVVGKAGTGKTFALDAARDAWEASGITVRGCALAARAAAELEAGSGIPSATIVRTTADLTLQRLTSTSPPPSLLVVDESGMAGTRDLARLLDHAAALRMRVVLVGDHRQLPEVNAGGLFHALVNRLPAAELTVNRRQTEPWERDALDQLRHGDPAAALDAYDQRGRVVTGSNAGQLRDRLVADWHTVRSAGRAVMIAPTRADVDDLNQRARGVLRRHGALTCAPLTAAGREFQVGDVVVATRNRYRLGLLNGTRGSVTAIDHDQRSVTVTVDGSDRPVTIQAPNLDAGHLAHAYCTTAHKAQGATVDAAFVLGSEALYRELAYVALSRGRHTNHLYSVAGTQLTRTLQQSRRQDLAIEWPA